MGGSPTFTQPRLAATERLLNRGAELVCWVLKQMPNLEAAFSAKTETASQRSTPLVGEE